MSSLSWVFKTILSLLLFPLSSPLALAASSSDGSVFVYDSSDNSDAQFIFALNVNNATGDLYFHLEGPSGQAWLGVGVGSQMKGATMFIAYTSNNGSGVTLSPRLSTGETEPSYDDAIPLQELWGDQFTNPNTVDDTSYQIDAVCRNCTQYLGTGLDLNSKVQPFIFAMGPPHPFKSDSPSAGLWEHQYYGHFTVDMTQATSANAGAVPLGPYTQSGTSQATGFNEDHDPAQFIHGAIMTLVFVVLLPFGALFLRVIKTIKAHVITQTIASILFLMAFAGGCVLSGKYNRTKNFNSAHQVIGILILVAMLSQYTLGAVHHRIFKRTQQKTIMGKIHLFLGPGVIAFGIINGGLGFQLAETPELAIPYVILIVIVAAIYGTVRFCACTCFGRGGRRGKEGSANDEPEGFQFPTFGPSSSSVGAAPVYEHGNTGPPPAYGSDVRIPLQPYHSSTSVQQLSSQPVEPRGMV